jgi:hypothetical protein
MLPVPKRDGAGRRARSGQRRASSVGVARSTRVLDRFVDRQSASRTIAPRLRRVHIGHSSATLGLPGGAELFRNALPQLFRKLQSFLLKEARRRSHENRPLRPDVRPCARRNPGDGRCASAQAHDRLASAGEQVAPASSRLRAAEREITWARAAALAANDSDGRRQGLRASSRTFRQWHLERPEDKWNVMGQRRSRARGPRPGRRRDGAPVVPMHRRPPWLSRRAMDKPADPHHRRREQDQLRARPTA